MTLPTSQTRTINSVTDYHSLLQLDKPLHPLMSIIDFSEVTYRYPKSEVAIQMELYCISIKLDSNCVLSYGPHHYDFKEGVMSFINPGQVLTIESTNSQVTEGFSIVFHPDFLKSFPVASKLKSYAFFDYQINEVLFLSDQEKKHIRSLMESIKKEYQTTIDLYSQEAITAFIDLLLVYSKRYYNRQFITRKQYDEPLVIRFQKLLDAYFISDDTVTSVIPNVRYFADHLNMSPNYLSDLLRIVTGKSAQSLIQDKIIEETKTLLTTSNLTVAEIAYQLGFGQPQSLNRLFKKKTEVSPLQYRMVNR